MADVFDPVTLDTRTVTRCRIAGGDVVDYASDAEVPDVLYPTLGTDLSGQCWYLTSATTQYLILNRYADGSADVGYDPDPSDPGGVFAIGPTLPRCNSEPTPLTDPSVDAWNYVMSYVHEPPIPDLNPPPGDGITGLATFVGLPVPADHDATLSSGASTLEVEIEVDAIIIAWGDGATDSYPPDSQVLAGYPNGSATHIYEVKDPEGADLTVGYDWTARWRVVGGSWTALPVPNTTTSVGYPVAEVVSRLSD
ncbi:MAG: hypothetical protein ACRDU9_04225 [Acidimicrobiia bacterium]